MLIQSVMIEGGHMLLQSFIDEGLWDEARVLIGDKSFGNGLAAPKIAARFHASCRFGKDTILYYQK
jgi:diaminohydroxyphosphoribosylaminopyrimidine deaminase/5-amino-6-(5-phosphoribosylamino)uracil reductase